MTLNQFLALGIAALLLLPISATSTETCDGSTAEMHECIGAQYAIADKELNAVYKDLKRQLLERIMGSAETESDALETDKRLVAAQRAWISFRDAECQLQGIDMLGGSGEGLIIHSCRLSMTKERVKALRDLSI